MAFAMVIKIVSQPHGDAPEWVRDAWIGCSLPCARSECGHIETHVESALPPPQGLQKATEFFAADALHEQHTIAGYSVTQEDALRILEEHRPDAAAWWREQGYPKQDPGANCFRFARGEIEVVAVLGTDEDAAPDHDIWDTNANWIA